MKIQLNNYFLKFNVPFSIAHGTRTGTDIVLLNITYDNVTGTGEASLPPYLPETTDTVHNFINEFFQTKVDYEEGLDSLLNRVMNFRDGNFAAKACIDIALHNLFAKMASVPVWKMLGLDNHPLPYCTFTIGMGTRIEIENKIKEAEKFEILKVKLGGEHDKEIISWIRESTGKKLCVDVNQGWADKEMALDMLHWLNEKDILFVEQPLSKQNIEEMKWLHERSPLPLYADESVQTISDIKNIRNAFDGINIKLMKCGGIREALRMIKDARTAGLKVLIGSMSETGCGINAASQLSSLADYVDLDGPLLTQNNPFDIAQYENGKLLL